MTHPSGRALAAAALLVLIALTGCFGDDTPDDGAEDHDDMDDHDDGDHTDDNGTDDLTTTGYNLTFEGDPLSGEANLTVTFTADVTVEETTTYPGDPDQGIPDENVTETRPYEGNLTYTMEFGDGTPGAEGNESDFPLATDHNYTTGGNYTATLTMDLEDGTMITQTLAVNVTAPAGPGGDPPQLVFELGPSLGCTGDVQGLLCLSYEGGPDLSGVDGFWVPLDERYWGLQVIGQIDKGAGLGSEGQWPLYDSDCAFLDAAHAVIGEGNNGEGACAGLVPAGSAWLFLYSYATPAAAQTVEFQTG